MTINRTSLLVALSVLCTPAFAHERITFGPTGGRAIALDSPSTPNAEFNVRDNAFVVTLLDQNRKPMPAKEHTLTVTAGDRSNPQKLKVQTKEGAFFAEPIPAGDDYWVILQLRESASTKPLTFRVHYQTHKCAECSKAEWICECGNKSSGANITVPDSLDGLFAEINQHHGELSEGVREKKYEAVDEVTDAFTVLLKALPAKSGDKAAAVQPQIDALVKDLAAIHEANAGRALKTAEKNLENVNSGLATLKKNYPEKTANSKL